MSGRCSGLVIAGMRRERRAIGGDDDAMDSNLTAAQLTSAP